MLGSLFVVFFLGLGAFLLYLWIKALIEVIQTDFEEAYMKPMLLLFLFIFPVVGASVYYLVQRRRIPPTEYV